MRFWILWGIPLLEPLTGDEFWSLLGSAEILWPELHPPMDEEALGNHGLEPKSEVIKWD
jgi:hypothetical protein